MNLDGVWLSLEFIAVTFCSCFSFSRSWVLFYNASWKYFCDIFKRCFYRFYVCWGVFDFLL
jgi:hypothetical protein